LVKELEIKDPPFSTTFIGNRIIAYNKIIPKEILSIWWRN
jgi:hypothetical protein